MPHHDPAADPAADDRPDDREMTGRRFGAAGALQVALPSGKLETGGAGRRGRDSRRITDAASRNREE